MDSIGKKKGTVQEMGRKMLVDILLMYKVAG